jgi:hypothetical protein
MQFCDSVPYDTDCTSFLHYDLKKSYRTATILGKLSAFPRQPCW